MLLNAIKENPAELLKKVIPLSLTVPIPDRVKTDVNFCFHTSL